MTTQLLDGLGLTSRLLLDFAAQHEAVPLHLALRAPLTDDPEQAIEELKGRGLVEDAEVQGVFRLSPMGYALREAVDGRWPQLHSQLRQVLLQHLVEDHGLQVDTALHRAMRAIDRARFVPDPARTLADLDMPVPTGSAEMTTSAPHALVAILTAVQPEPGDRVLVCGAKGGMIMALAAHMVGERGAVVGLDWDLDTVEQVRDAMDHYPELAARTEVRHQVDVTLGDPEGDDTWDVVVVNGCIPKIPWPIVDRLRPDVGRMLAFLQVPAEDGQVCYVLRRNGDVVRDEALSRFAFTPIYGRYGWDHLGEILARFQS